MTKPIITIETSSKLCSTGLFLNEEEYYEVNFYKNNIHSEKLLEMIDYLLTSKKILLKDCGLIAVSNGPGSFTGLRIGMSAAKALAFGADLPILTVPSLEVLALKVSSIVEQNTEFYILRKANLDEFYIGKYKSIGDNNITTMKEVKILKSEQLFELEKNIIIYYDVLPKNIDENTFLYKKLDTPESFYMAKWYYFFGKDLLTFNYDFLEPNYLKNFTSR